MHNTESVFFFIFVFAILVFSKFTGKFIGALSSKTPKRFILDNRELIILASSISYIITYISFK